MSMSYFELRREKKRRIAELALIEAENAKKF